LVVGLGNPDPKHARTRHNVGAEVVDGLAARYDTRLKAGRHQARIGEAVVSGRRVALAVPLTYMNESGQAVRSLVRRFGIDDLADLVVVHDELDLPVGRMKVKAAGGLAGHNGLRSIRAHLHDDGFTRIRIGVGKPPTKERGADHVLAQPSKADRRELDVVVVEAMEAVELMVSDGLAAAMGRFNTGPETP